MNALCVRERERERERETETEHKQAYSLHCNQQGPLARRARAQ